MSKINPNLGRAGFFPPKDQGRKVGDLSGSSIQRNSPERAREISGITAQDAVVEIPEAVKDFSKIKKAVDAAPDIDNSEKIADIKNKINSGTYKIDYDGLAEKMLTQDF